MQEDNNNRNQHLNPSCFSSASGEALDMVAGRCTAQLGESWLYKLRTCRGEGQGWPCLWQKACWKWCRKAFGSTIHSTAARHCQQCMCLPWMAVAQYVRVWLLFSVHSHLTLPFI